MNKFKGLKKLATKYTTDLLFYAYLVATSEEMKAVTSNDTFNELVLKRMKDGKDKPNNE